MRDALSLFDQVIAFSGLTISDEDVADALGLIDQTLVSNLAKALMAGDAGTALDLLNQMFNFGYDTKDLAAQVLEYFRSLVVIKVSKNPEKILDMLDAELSDLKTAAVDVSLPTLNFHFNAWLDVQSRLARATQPRLVLEALIVRLAQVEPLQPLADLVARLESLLAGAGPLPTGGGGGTPSGQRGGGPGPGPGPGPGRIPIPPDRSPGGGGRMASPPAAETKSASTPKKAGPVAADPSKKGPPPGPKDWPGFLQFLRSNNPVSATMLERGQLKGFSPEKVEILFGDKSMMGLIDWDDILKILTDFWGGRPELVMQYKEGAVGASGNGSGKMKDENQIRNIETPPGPGSHQDFFRPGGGRVGRQRRIGNRNRCRPGRTDGLESIMTQGVKTPLWEEKMAKGMGPMGNLVKQAQKMQQKIAKLQEELGEKTITASSGGGMVTVEANGNHEIKSISIDKEVVDPEDVEMLEDLILAAANEALKQAQEMVAAEMQKVTGGMNIPGLF